MQGGWQPPGGGGMGGPPGGYGAPPGGQPPATMPTAPAPQGGYGPPAAAPGGYGAPAPGAMQPAGYGAPPPNPYAPPGAPGMGGFMGFGQYEFNEMENGIIAKTAGRAKTWGIIAIVIGSIEVLSGFAFFVSPGLLLNFITGIAQIVIGVTFLGVGNSLTQVVQTQGNDVEHMMGALNKLSSAFMIQIIMAIVQAVLIALAILLVIFVFAAMAVSGP